MGYDIQAEREEKERQAKRTAISEPTESPPKQNVNVVLIGVQSGKDVKTITASLAKRFDVDVHHFEPLFSEGRKIVKKNQPKEKAERFAKIFRDAGAIIELEPIQEQKKIMPVITSPIAIRQEEKISKEQKKPFWLAPLVIGIVTGIVSGYFLFNTFRVNIYGLTEDENKLVQMLDSELKRTEKEIEEANNEYEKYEKTISKSILQIRISTLHLTADMLKQKLYSTKIGANKNITINSLRPDNEQAATLEKTINTQMQVVEQAKSDAISNGGGAGDLQVSRLASEQQTLAMLRLLYYTAKYGLYFEKISPVASDNSSSNSKHAVNNDSAKESADFSQEKHDKENLEVKNLELCKSVASFSLEVMKKRQDEVPMYKLLEVAHKEQPEETAKLFEMIVEQAYSEIAMRTPENKKRQQDEFSNKIFRQCYRSN